MFKTASLPGRRLTFLACLMFGLSVVQTAAADTTAFTQRIIDGQSVPITTYPSTVALLSTDNFSVFNRQFCAGSVVAPRWVLTAAHCVHSSTHALTSPDTLRILEGSTELTDSAENREHLVVNVIPHPLYVSSNNQDYNNDIALLEVATDLESPPIRLFDLDADTLAGSFAFIVGWGANEIDESGRSSFPIDLRAAAVPFVTRAVCNTPQSYQGLITQNMFCAGFQAGGADTCQADSGGPLYAVIDGELEQVGITSFGNGCGIPDFYGVYTHVPTYQTWLSDYIPIAGRTTANNPSLPSEDDPGAGSDSDVDGANDVGLNSGGSSGGASLAFSWLLGFVLIRSRLPGHRAR